MFKTILIATLIMTCASVAAAQSDTYKRFEIFGGFSHNRIDTDIEDADPAVLPTVGNYQGFNGFNTSLTLNFATHAGLKFDFSGHYKNQSINTFNVQNGLEFKSSIYNFLGGIQYKDVSEDGPTFKPFVHLLAGAARGHNRIHVDQQVCIAIVPNPCPPDFTVSDTGFAAALGGGLDIRANERIDIRVIQADYNPTRLFGSTQHNFRFGVGLVFH